MGVCQGSFFWSRSPGRCKSPDGQVWIGRDGILGRFGPSLSNILPCYVHTHFREHQSKQADYGNCDCKSDGSPHVSLHLWCPPIIMDGGYQLETNHCVRCITGRTPREIPLGKFPKRFSLVDGGGARSGMPATSRWRTEDTIPAVCKPTRGIGHPAHGALHRAVVRSVQRPVEGLRISNRRQRK